MSRSTEADRNTPTASIEKKSVRHQIGVGVGILILAMVVAAGALKIPSDIGYSGIGPNFLPWLVSAALFACGIVLIYEAGSGGFREMEEVGDEQPYWPGFIWMSSGLLFSATFIGVLGFVITCALCFTLATRGLRNAQGQTSLGWQSWVKDVITGLMIAAPVYWLFTKFLAINLPGLTASGWL